MKRFSGTWVIWLLIGGFFLFQALPALKQFGGLGLDIGQAFPLISMEKVNGEQVPLALGQDNLIVLNVWATWCAPCRKELPMLQQLAKDWSGRGVEVILVNEEITSKHRVADYLDSVHIDLQNYFLTSGEVRKLGGIGVVPTTFIISADDLLTHRFNRMVSRSELEQVIRKLVAEKAGLEQKKANTDEG